MINGALQEHWDVAGHVRGRLDGKKRQRVSLNQPLILVRKGHSAWIPAYCAKPRRVQQLSGNFSLEVQH